MVQLKPAHVSEHRRVQGQRRIKTDAIDLEAITELLLAVRHAGHHTHGDAGRVSRLDRAPDSPAGHPHRDQTQLLAQLDRSFPGLTPALPDAPGTKIRDRNCPNAIPPVPDRVD